MEEVKDTVLKDLQELLRHLSAPPISLTILSSYAAKKSKRISSFSSSLGNQSSEDHFFKQAREEELKLFETYIGPYNDVLEGACRHVKSVYEDEIFYSESNGGRRWNRYNDPDINGIEGPRPDMHVWMGLFLGKAEEESSREQYETDNTMTFPPPREEEICYSNVYDAFRRNGEVRKMPVLTVARNILRYLADLANNESIMELKQLLYFCAVYGFSSAARNVLDGKYGEIPPEGLTIDTLLSVPRDREPVYCIGRPWHVPFVGVSAVLGYRHSVLFAIEKLGSNLHTKKAYSEVGGAIKLTETGAGAFALKWCILSKQPEMVKCLTENGVQFRHLSNYDLKGIFHTIFHIDCSFDERGPLWYPEDYDDDDLDSMRDIRRYRATQCYLEKQKMLSTIIAAGIPRDLFIPSNVCFDAIKEKANKISKAKGLKEPNNQIWKQVLNADNTKDEQRCIAVMNEACMEYNAVTVREKRKSIFEFVQHVNDLFLHESDGSMQNSSTDELEAADPRWVQRVKNGGRVCPWWEEPDSDEEDYDY